MAFKLDYDPTDSKPEKLEVTFKVRVHRIGGDGKRRPYDINVPGSITDTKDGDLWIRFRFNKVLVSEIKSFEGAKWREEQSAWQVKNTQRNWFQLRYLFGENPYAPYDLPLVELKSDRPLMAHQFEMGAFGLTRHYCILAAEMRTGKSLSSFEIMEHSGHSDWWFCGPKSGLRSVQLELEKWKCKIKPKMMTYDELRNLMKRWPPGKKAPRGVFYDESSLLKNPTAQRTQAAQALADGIRQDWGPDGFVILMTGTPAPKTPVDWYPQCEIACPGFIKEGTPAKFRNRLAVVVQKEAIQGGTYPALVTWKDNDKKCDVCGQFENHPDHNEMALVTGGNYHSYVPGKNEVAYLYERMKGLVMVKFKKDCLDLPEKRYEIIYCKPTASILRSASLIQSRAKTVISAMTLLRELSDGFQYIEEAGDDVVCSLCKGRKEIDAPEIDRTIEIDDDNIQELIERWPDHVSPGDEGTTFTPPEQDDTYAIGYKDGKVPCPKCGGLGMTPTYHKEAIQVPCPKEDVVKQLLGEYEEAGRTVFWAGFQGSIQRLKTIVTKEDWHWFKVDGHGWETSLGRMSELDMLRIFQQGVSDKYPKIAFLGQPGAGGMGLALHASPMACYYSNDFNGQSRMQSEERVHAPGMDMNRGCTIYDLIHLPTDELVRRNLFAKKDLQAMSMGDLKQALAHAEAADRVH